MDVLQSLQPLCDAHVCQFIQHALQRFQHPLLKLLCSLLSVQKDGRSCLSEFKTKFPVSRLYL